MAAPQAGQVVDGYRFKGGDPSDQKAWERLSGDAALAAMDPDQADKVKALSEGRLAFPTGKASADPYWQKLVTDTARYDPSFDVTNPRSRAAGRVSATSGPLAQNRTALNTVVGHLDHLDRSIDGLGNYAGDEKGPLLGLPLGPLAHTNNALARKIAEESGTNERYKDFEAAKTAVSNELTRVFRGNSGAEADIQNWMKQLDGTQSPGALKTVVRSMAQLMQSRVDALGDQYKQSLGVSKDPLTLLEPDKAAAYQRLMGANAPGPSRADQARAKLGVDPGKYASPKPFTHANGAVVVER